MTLDIVEIQQNNLNTIWPYWIIHLFNKFVSRYLIVELWEAARCLVYGKMQGWTDPATATPSAASFIWKYYSGVATPPSSTTEQCNTVCSHHWWQCLTGCDCEPSLYCYESNYDVQWLSASTSDETHMAVICEWWSRKKVKVNEW